MNTILGISFWKKGYVIDNYFQIHGPASLIYFAKESLNPWALCISETVVRDVHAAGFPHLETEEMYWKKLPSPLSCHMSVTSGYRGVREQNPSFKRLVLKTRNSQQMENNCLDAITEPSIVVPVRLLVQKWINSGQEDSEHQRRAWKLLKRSKKYDKKFCQKVKLWPYLMFFMFFGFGCFSKG